MLNRLLLLAVLLPATACVSAQTVHDRKTTVSALPQGTCVKTALVQLEQEMKVQTALRENRPAS